MVYAKLSKKMASIKLELISGREVNFQTVILNKCEKRFKEKYDEERLVRIQRDIRTADTVREN